MSEALLLLTELLKSAIEISQLMKSAHAQGRTIDTTELRAISRATQEVLDGLKADIEAARAEGR